MIGILFPKLFANIFRRIVENAIQKKSLVRIYCIGRKFEEMKFDLIAFCNPTLPVKTGQAVTFAKERDVADIDAKN